MHSFLCVLGLRERGFRTKFFFSLNDPFVGQGLSNTPRSYHLLKTKLYMKGDIYLTSGPMVGK